MSAQISLPRQRRISCVGFDWRAEVSLKETLLLLRGKTHDHWEYTDELLADVLVYDEHNALAQAMLRRRGSHAALRQVLFSSAGDDEQGLSMRPPFGASRLIRCLDHASTELGAAPSATSDRSDSLCQQLDVALRAPGTRAVALHTQGFSGLIRVDDLSLHWPQPMGVDETAALLSGTVEVQRIDSKDDATLQQLLAAAPVVTSAEGLLWAIGITRSRNTLLQRLYETRPYRLQRWPDFGLIGRRSLDLRCAALLTQRELTPSNLSQLSGMPLSVIGGFLNAAALCGLLEAGSATAQVPNTTRGINADSPPSRLGGMLRRIRQALALS